MKRLKEPAHFLVLVRPDSILKAYCSAGLRFYLASWILYFSSRDSVYSLQDIELKLF